MYQKKDPLGYEDVYFSIVNVCLHVGLCRIDPSYPVYSRSLSTCELCRADTQVIILSMVEACLHVGPCRADTHVIILSIVELCLHVGQCRIDLSYTVYRRCLSTYGSCRIDPTFLVYSRRLSTYGPCRPETQVIILSIVEVSTCEPCRLDLSYLVYILEFCLHVGRVWVDTQVITLSIVEACLHVGPCRADTQVIILSIVELCLHVGLCRIDLSYTVYSRSLSTQGLCRIPKLLSYLK